MSKSIRYMTDKGFLSLIKDMESKYKFLDRVESSNHRFIYLDYYDIRVAHFDVVDKRVTLAELGILLTRKNGIDYAIPKGGKLEDIKTRRTLVKRFNDFQQLIAKYYGE